MHSMTKDTFALEFDVDTDVTYLRKAQDEVTKNDQETNEEVQTGFMPQIMDLNGHLH